MFYHKDDLIYMSLYSGKKFTGFLAFILSLACLKTEASCTVEIGSTVVSSLLVTLPLTPFDPFDPTVPDGTVLYSTTAQGNSQTGDVYCSSAIGRYEYRGVGAVGRFNTYSTSVSGVGIRIHHSYIGWWPKGGSTGSTSYPIYGNSPRVEVELVKTGPITAGGRLTGLIGALRFVDHGVDVQRFVISGNLEIKPRVPTCTVSTPAIAVGMGKVHVNALADKGATNPARPLEIRLQCSGGDAGAHTRMFMTLSDAANPGNRSTTLSLLSGTSATGVGIQILRSDDTPVSFGPDSAVAGNPNQWQIGEFGNGQVTIPLKARYIPTGGKVGPGTANAAATFTMSYQ
ncbi:fimbrial protein [Pseudomonas chlororaphis subsp. aurantiaca]|uniref:Type 1 fimbrial protein n=1 Tax=Pseudomonas chlororaphis subsp. aurantiaca TaxID=86192 RepID=A0AAJ0ZHM5_9PSED|nr:fimbrial protein [Pseudomonas chlororaphis]MBU4632475.1 type 1 fimbrial protein [Pseudomonas chlororaphis subsp. aurantiaca]